MFRRKSLSGRSLLNSPATVDTSDPAVWLPLMITEAEKLATYCKVLASKVGNNWYKDGASNKIEESGNGHSEKELDKLKVVACCRKLRKAVVTTRLNMKLLEKKLVNKFEQKYGNAADIEVESRPTESSSSNQGSTPRCGKRLIVKIKNFREANRKQDFYAEIRNSPIPPSSTPTHSKTAPSSRKSDGSINSLATLPLANSPLPTRSNPDDDDLSNQATSIQNDDENMLLNEEESHLVDDNEQFFDLQSDLVEDKPTETPNPLELDELESTVVADERKSKSSLADTLKFAQDGDTSTLDASPKSLSLRMSLTSDGVLNNDTISQGSAGTTTSPTLLKTNLNKTQNDQIVQQSKRPDSETVEKRATKLKLTQSTPSSNDKSGRNFKHDVKDEAKPTAMSTPLKSNLSSTVDLNEKARQELLKSSDSDDSLDEIKLSPRVKRTKKRTRIPPLGLDDPKLKAGCTVVVSRITDLVIILKPQCSFINLKINISFTFRTKRFPWNMGSKQNQRRRT